MGLVKHGRPDRGNGVFYELPEVGVLQAAFARLIGMGVMMFFNIVFLQEDRFFTCTTYTTLLIQH